MRQLCSLNHETARIVLGLVDAQHLTKMMPLSRYWNDLVGSDEVWKVKVSLDMPGSKCLKDAGITEASSRHMYRRLRKLHSRFPIYGRWLRSTSDIISFAAGYRMLVHLSLDDERDLVQGAFPLVIHPEDRTFFELNISGHAQSQLPISQDELRGMSLSLVVVDQNNKTMLSLSGEDMYQELLVDDEIFMKGGDVPFCASAPWRSFAQSHAFAGEGDEPLYLFELTNIGCKEDKLSNFDALRVSLNYGGGNFLELYQMFNLWLASEWI